jgi:hypothetical protein
MHGGMKMHKHFSPNFEGKRQLGRNRHRWKYTIQMDHKEIACKVVSWIHLVQDSQMAGCCGHDDEHSAS